MKNFKDNIINKIKTGEIDMKPRWHFVLKSLLLVSGLLTVALLVIYLLSFIFFALRQSGIAFAPLYGFKGVSLFVMSSPWLLIALAGVFVVLLYVLVTKYSFSYQKPLLYSMIGVILLVLVGSFVLQETGMHQRLQQYSERHNVPVFTPLYKGLKGERPDNVLQGTITELTSEGFILQVESGDRVIVVTTEETRQRPTDVRFVGESVFVFGDREGETISAFGIRPIELPKEAGRGMNTNRDSSKPPAFRHGSTTGE